MSEDNERSRESAVGRIRKLLQRASQLKADQENGSRVPEAEVEQALRFAREMMDKMNISEKEVFVQPDHQEAAYASIKEHVSFSRAGGLEIFFKWLAMTTCNICDVKYYSAMKWMKNPSPRKGEAESKHERECIVFYGLPRDVAVAHEVLEELIVSVHTMARFRNGKGWTKSHMDYARGFATRLVERSQEIKTTSTGTSDTTAIVLVKDGLLKKWADSNLSLKHSKSRATIKDDSAYNSGRTDAESVSLGTNQIRGSGSPAKKMIGS